MPDAESQRPRSPESIRYRYQFVLQFGSHALVYDSHGKEQHFYAQWYDGIARQVRRRSLRTTVSDVAIDIMRRIQRAGVRGDPVALLRDGAFVHIKDVLADYKASHAGLASAGQTATAIDHLNRHIGHIRVEEWTKQDFRTFKEAFIAEGYKLSYLSRINAVLRAALNEAEDEEKIARAPSIPEVATEAEKDAAPLLGRLMTTKEIAALIDQAGMPHFLEYLIGLINSASRPVTMLESDTNQIEWHYPIFDMNPAGRTQTKKHRPILRVSDTWRPWLEQAPLGRLITYDGKPVRSVKKAMRTARKAANLGPDKNGVGVNSYSIRHTIGRFFEECGVPDIQRSIFLGHVKIERKKTTDRYSPLNPRGPLFLREATEAIEKFVRDIAAQTKKWDLLAPHKTKAGFKAGPSPMPAPGGSTTAGGQEADDHAAEPVRSAEILPFRVPDRGP